MSELSELTSWLASVTGDSELDWEMTAHNIQALNALRAKSTRNEQLLQVTLEETERLSREYEGELRRLNRILKELGMESTGLAGSSAAYIQALAESCAQLGEDNMGRGAEVALSRVVADQAVQAPRLAAAKHQIEAVKVENLKMYSQLERLGEAVGVANKEGESDLEITKSQTKKLDFMNAKEKQYRNGLEKDELTHLKLTGGDNKLTHNSIQKMEENLNDLVQNVEEAKRNMSGYLNLPPSMELARLEISKAETRLQELTTELNVNIASVHL